MTINKSKGKSKNKNSASPATTSEVAATPDAVTTPEVEADAVTTPEVEVEADAVTTPEVEVEADAVTTPEVDEEEEKKPNRKVARMTNLVNTAFHKKRDPYAEITFLPGNRVEGVKVTSWMQAQIDAGILKEVK